MLDKMTYTCKVFSFSDEKIRLFYQVHINVSFNFSIAKNTWRVSLICENEYNFDFGHVSIDFFLSFFYY